MSTDAQAPVEEAKPKHTRPIAIIHPDNPEKKVEKHDVVEHPSGPLEGYFEGTYNEFSDDYSW